MLRLDDLGSSGASTATICIASVLDRSGSTVILRTASFSSDEAGTFSAKSCSLNTPAACSVRYNRLVRGQHTIAASYGGDADHAGSTATFVVSVI